MVFLLLGLSVYVGMKVLMHVIEVRFWWAKVFWYLSVIGASALALWAAGENPAWCLAVAGIAGLWERVDHILGGVRDWIRVSVLRGPPRR